MISLDVILTIFLCFGYISSSENNCGKPIGYGAPGTARKDRIVGGYDMGYYKYPWYAALVSDKTVGCGGALINSRTVLTAAHCFKSSSKYKPENMYVVKLGVYNICTTENTQVEFKVQKVKIHELYAKKNPYYDIALVTLQEDASSYTPICLPGHAILKRPKEGLVPGLGVLKYDGDTPCTLQESRLLIHPDGECRSMLNKVEKNISNVLNAFCAGYIQGGIDTCQGDSGGPLQILSEDGRYTQLGIVSFGYKCASPGLLGLYTDVSKYVDWIKKHSRTSLSSEHDNSDETSVDPTTSSSSTSKPEETSRPLETVSTIPSPLPSIISVGTRPNQVLQYYPVRPVGAPRPPFQSPINIFIFNRKALRKTDKKSTTKEKLTRKKKRIEYN